MTDKDQIRNLEEKVRRLQQENESLKRLKERVEEALEIRYNPKLVTGSYEMNDARLKEAKLLLQLLKDNAK